MSLGNFPLHPQVTIVKIELTGLNIQIPSLTKQPVHIGFSSTQDYADLFFHERPFQQKLSVGGANSGLSLPSFHGSCPHADVKRGSCTTSVSSREVAFVKRKIIGYIRIE